jgi:hypothetical protein
VASFTVTYVLDEKLLAKESLSASNVDEAQAVIGRKVIGNGGFMRVTQQDGSVIMFKSNRIIYTQIEEQ